MIGEFKGLFPFLKFVFCFQKQGKRLQHFWIVFGYGFFEICFIF